MAGLVAAGGSSTINGVVYQLLCSLLHVGKLHVYQPIDSSVEAPERVTIILEPRNGGGDLQLRSDSGVIVEQIKARSNGTTWSLREIVEGVLPDLFLAVDANPSTARTFRFVTEGRMGAWNNVYEGFFRDIRNRRACDSPLVGLDDINGLRFKRQIDAEETFFPRHTTERALFLKIAEVIANRPAVQKLKLNEPELFRRVRALLGSFEFVGGQDIQLVQQSIDTVLLAIVDNTADIPAARDHLAMELARASSVGGVEIEATSFLSELGYDAIPLSNWTVHLNRARNLLKQSAASDQYDEIADVRASDLPPIPAIGNALVLTGECGTGKTWMLNALARSASGPLLPIVVESEGSANATLRKCAERFWHEIHDGDDELLLPRVAKRLKKLVKCDTPGLLLLIDAVGSYEEARRLVEQDWNAWNSSLVVACRPDLARSLQQAYPNRVSVYECRDFTWEELHEYIDRRLDSGWAEIPSDVRGTLRRPLLAGIYCAEFGDRGWDSPSEYELYQRVWERLSTGPQSDRPLDAACVELLARRLREGSPYPWSQGQLIDAGIDNDALIRLQRCGWLVRVGERYRVFHDRLLQWAVARSLCSDLRDGRISADELIQFVTSQVRQTSCHDGMIFGYVPMDVLWMLSQGSEKKADVSARILKSLEDTGYAYVRELYTKLVPTVGSGIADAVYERFRSSESDLFRNPIAECLSDVGRSRIEEFARPFIESTDRKLQRRGIAILRLVGCSMLLDQIWTIHVNGQADPVSFGDESSKDWELYRETFNALRLAVQDAHDWLREKIASADPDVDPVYDLAYLAASLRDQGKTWFATKEVLFRKMPPDKPRSLVTNIACFRDVSETAWLRQWIGSNVDFAAPFALQALSRLDPDASVAELSKIRPFDLNSTRHWSFAEVFARRPLETNAAMLRWMKVLDDPWKVALAFQDRENDISTEQLTTIVNSLSQNLSDKLCGHFDPRRGLYMELEFLSKLASPELLKVLHGRRESEFESRLCRYALSFAPQTGDYATNHERDSALAVLNLIGGAGLTTVVNELLKRCERHEIDVAIVWASKRPDATTLNCLRDIALSDECWPTVSGGTYPVNQNDAMRVLASRGCWDSVAIGLQKWGLRTHPSLKECPEPVSAPWVDLLRSSVRLTPTPGNVLALGTVGDIDDCACIHKILEQCSAESELAHACIIALEDLDDRSAEGVAKVGPHLNIKDHRYSAVRMLQNSNTGEAWAVLFEYLKKHFDFAAALNLINHSELGESVVELALEKIPECCGIDDCSQLKLFISEIRSTEFRNRILNDARVRELLHEAAADTEGGFWFVGAKAAAIECMAKFAPDAAFAAGCRVLSDPDAHDRERIPAVLAEIDRERGIQWLLNHFPSEKSALVRVAIGRTLEDSVPFNVILEGFDVEDEKTRSAMVELAGWSPLHSSIDVALQNALDDSSPKVIRAAIASIHRRKDRRVCTALTQLVEEETNPSERMVFLDALFGFVDPGDDDRLHPELQRALRVVTDFEANGALDRLRKRRRKYDDELKKKDTQGR